MSEMEVTEGQLLSRDFGVGGPPATPERTLGVVEMEIRVIQHQTGQAILNGAIEMGRRLEEAKAMVGHGEWGPWLKKMGYSQSNANNLMRVFREYGSTQQSLFGAESKSQTFGSLTFSKALSLLAIPDEEERERFVTENDVEHMSVRELNEALKARNEAEEKAAAAEDEARGLRQETERLREELADQAQAYKAKLTAADVETTEANRKAREAQEALDKQREKAQRLQDALSEANTSAQAAEEEHTRLLRELEELRSRPVDVAIEVDEEAVEAARKAAVAEMTEKVDKAKDAKKKADTARKAAEEALAAAKKELEELQAKEPQVRELTPEELQAMTADAVEKARAGELAKVKELEKKLAAADGDVSAFRIHYEAWQDHYNKLSDYLTKIASREPERAGKLHMAVKAVIERMAAG